MTTARTSTIQVGDLDVFYHEAGSGDPLVLLHGGIVTAEMMYGERIVDLARDYHIYAPDSRGHGRTNNPAGTLGYAQMADDVAGFIDALDIHHPHLAGYSDGGQISLEFGIRHPGKARTLTLGGTISSASTAYLDTLQSWGFTAPGEVDYGKLEATFGKFLATVKTVHGQASGPHYWKTFLPQISELWRSVPTYSDQQLASIADPVLVIMGDRDGEDGLDHARRLYGAMPNAQLAIVPGSPHGAVERDIFWTIVRDFHARQGIT